MQLEVGGQVMDEAALSIEDLVAQLHDGVHTSGPSPGAFVEVFDRLPRDCDIVVLTVGAHLSSTYQAATTAASIVQASHRVEVVDTGTAAGAEGLVVAEAADTAMVGASVDAVVARAVEVAAKVRLVAAVDELTYLARGGRVPSIAAWAGSHLGVRILFEFRRDGVHPLRPSLSQQGALEHILGLWRASRVDASLHVAALHALREGQAHSLLEQVSAEVEPALSFVATFGPVMVAHTGPGVIGLAWWWGP
jgi:DegV family protein with EDD domain